MSTVQPLRCGRFGLRELTAMAAVDISIAIDFMDMTDDGRLWTSLRDVRNGFVPIAGQYVVVGCEDADPAVAQIISVDIERGISLKVLDGSVEGHRHLLPPT